MITGFWSLLNITSKQIQWVLDKALPDIVLSKQSITLDSNNLTDIFTITTNSTGNLSVVSSDDSIVTVSLSDNTVSVEGLTNGNATITISVTENGNYLSNSKTLSVTCSLINETFGDNTPGQIQSAVANGQASSLWSAGDTIDITLVSGTVGSVTLSGTYKFAILGIDHNNSKELPSDKSHSLHFCLSKNSSGTEIAFTDWADATDRGNIGYSNSYFIHSGSGSWGSNAGGWASSNMRTICSSFLNRLPSEWQNVITAIPKYTDNKGNGNNSALASYVTATMDKIWLLAEWEIFGSSSNRYYANRYERDSQEQYDYYKNGNSRARYGHQQTNNKVIWWERSANAGETDNFCAVDAWNGTINSFVAVQRSGFVPCFAICG